MRKFRVGIFFVILSLVLELMPVSAFEKTAGSEQLAANGKNYIAAETAAQEPSVQSDTSAGVTTAEYVSVNDFGTVRVTVPSNAFDEVVHLVVSQADQDQTSYSQAKQALDEDINYHDYDGMIVLDINFVNASGNKVEPNGEAVVSIDLASKAIADARQDSAAEIDNSTITVTHIVDENGSDDKFVEIVADTTAATDGSVTASAQSQDETAISTEFTVDSFSSFIIYWKNMGNPAGDNTGASATWSYFEVPVTYVVDNGDGTFTEIKTDKAVADTDIVPDKPNGTDYVDAEKVNLSTFQKSCEGYAYDHFVITYKDSSNATQTVTGAALTNAPVITGKCVNLGSNNNPVYNCTLSFVNNGTTYTTGVATATSKGSFEVKLVYKATSTPGTGTVADPDLNMSKTVVNTTGDEYTLTLGFSGFSDSEVTISPVDILLILDVSGSMQGTRLANTKAAATTLVNNLFANEKLKDIIRFSVVSFNDAATVNLDWSSNQTSVLSAISALHVSSYGTNYEAGFIQGINQLNNRGADYADAKTVVIFLTDGEPTSRVSSDFDSNLDAAIGVAGKYLAANAFFSIGYSLTTSQTSNLTSIKDAVKALNTSVGTSAYTDGIYSTNDSTIATAFDDIFTQITNIDVTKVKVTDVLADSVTMSVISPTSYKVSVYKRNSDGSNGDLVSYTNSAHTVLGSSAVVYLKATEKNSATALTITYDESPTDSRLVLQFPDSYRLEPDYNYVITATVEMTDAGYDGTVTANGVESNRTGSGITYSYNNKDYSDEFNMQYVTKKTTTFAVTKTYHDDTDVKRPNMAALLSYLDIEVSDGSVSWELTDATVTDKGSGVYTMVYASGSADPGTESYTVTATVTDNNDGTFGIVYSNLRQYQGANAVTYALTEDTQNMLADYGYTGSNAASGNAVTNTYRGRTSITVTKSWVGDAAGQPDSVTVTLYRQAGSAAKEIVPDYTDYSSNETHPTTGIGNPVGPTDYTATVVLNAANNWTFTWNGLAIVDGSFNTYSYSVVEAVVDGYVTSYGSSSTGLTVTNSKAYQVKVTKSFTGITRDELPANFKIVNSYNSTEFTLANASQVSADGLDYTWIMEAPAAEVITFTESGYAIDGYNVVTTPAAVSNVVSKSVTVSTTVANNVAAFVNAYTAADYTVTVTKTFTGLTKAELPTGFKITNDYNSTVFTLANGTASSDGLTYTWTMTAPYLTSVKFTESGYDVAGYDATTTPAAANGTVSQTLVVCKTVANNVVSFTNAYTEKLIMVTVTKTFTGLTKAELPSGFKITNDYDNTVFTLASGTASADGLTYTWTMDVPYKTTVKFTESGYDVAGYSVTTTPAAVNNAVSKSVTVSTTESDNAAAFTNAYSSSDYTVTVTKTFTGLTKDELPSGFKIANNYNSTVFTLANGTASADGLTYTWTMAAPYKTAVKFTESGYEVAGYDVTTTPAAASGAVSQTVTVSTAAANNSTSFTNAYTVKDYTVTVTKTFTGLTKAELPTANFKITNDYNNTVFTLASGTASADGLTYTWTINVPYKTVIKFTESGYDVTGFNVTTTPAAVSNVISSSVTVSTTESNNKTAFTNAYSASDYTVTVTKTFTGLAKTELPTANFKIANDYNSTVFTLANGTASSDGLTYTWMISVPNKTAIVFTESGYAVSGYDVVTTPAIASGAVSQTVTVSTVTANNSTSFTNAYTVKDYTVTVSKTFAGLAKAELPSGFKITNDYDNTVFTLATGTASSDDLTYTWTIDVPYKTAVKFTESGYDVAGYDVVTSPASVGNAVSQTVTVGMVAANNKTSFSNTYTAKNYTVTVSKTFTGLTTAELPSGFKIANDYNSTVFTLANGTASSDGLTYTWAIDVPYKTAVKFTESGYAVDGFDVTTTPAAVSGAVSQSVTVSTTAANNTAAFTNAYTAKKFTVTVAKIFSGLAKTELPTADFKITNDYDNTVFTLASGMTSSDGLTYIWMIDVPYKTAIKFTESGYTVDGYNVRTTPLAVNGAVSQTVTVDLLSPTNSNSTAFSNEYFEADYEVKVTKTFSGLTKAELPAGFKIVNDYDDTEFTLATATASNNDMTYTWTIDVPYKTTVKFTESGYAVEGYEVATAPAAVNGSVSQTVTVTATAADNATSFTNTYTPENYTVTVTKVFAGLTTAELPSAGFQIGNNYNNTVFTLADGTASADGLTYEWTIEVPYKTSVVFTESGYAVDGYDVTTSPAAANGSVSQTVTVTTTAADNSTSFENTYSETNYTVTVIKIFTGLGPNSLPADAFMISNDYDSSVIFDISNGRSSDGLTYIWSIEIPYKTAVTFTESGYQVDGYDVTTTPAAVNGAVSVSSTVAIPTSETSNTLTFENEYKPYIIESDPPVQKVVKGNPPTDDEFTFVMTAEKDTNPMPEGSAEGVKTMSVVGAGPVEFGVIKFTEPGVYNYTITEQKGTNSKYTYDTTTYTVTYRVNLADNKLTVDRTITADGSSAETVVFTNTYKNTPPYTGDDSAKTLYVSLLTTAAAGLAVLLFSDKKRRQRTA